MLLGWLGSFFQLSISLKVILQIAVAIFMLGTAANILELHPIFRYFIIQPPKFLTRLVRKQSKSKDCYYCYHLSEYIFIISAMQASGAKGRFAKAVSTISTKVSKTLPEYGGK
jgi:hypothetical protein